MRVNMANEMFALLGAMMGFAILFGIAFYIYFALALMTIAKKTKTENPWLAWIPIANIYLMTQIAEVSPWTMLILLAGFIPVLGGIAIMAVMIWWWWKICEARDKPGWWSLLLLVPIVNIIIVGVIAWSD